MGQVICVDSGALPWQVPDKSWAGSVPDGHPVVQFKTVDPPGAFTRVQIAHYEPGHVENAHSHAMAEVLYITQGDMKVGDRSVSADMVLFIDKETVYGPLVAGPQGTTFLRVEVGA